MIASYPLHAKENYSGPFNLVEGSKIEFVTKDKSLKIYFDGKDDIAIKNSGASFHILAKTPAALSVSPSHKILVLNFGNGSGQVYDVELYFSDSGKKADIVGFRNKVLHYAYKRGCRIKPDQISFIFKGWNLKNEILLNTEDFSRRSGCNIMNRSWTLKI